MRNTRIKSGVWLERLTTFAVLWVVAGSLYRAFWSPPVAGLGPKTFSQYQRVAVDLRHESDPVRRDNLGTKAPVVYRLLDARMPPNTRMFVLGMLGPENFGQLGIYYYLTYYLHPREVAISLGQPPAFQLDGFAGRNPSSLEELKQAGYDFVLQIEPGESLRVQALGSLPLQAPEIRLKPIPAGDGITAFLLPLMVAITGSRLVRWIFPDIKAILSTGELLAGGLAVGAFFLTQLTLALRLAGARLEQPIAIAITVWAVGEGVLLVRCFHALRPQLKAHYLWWLLLIPAGLILWCQFRLASLLDLQELDGIAIWAFKAKILHCSAGQEMWTWFKNPALAYAHMDYPLLVPLLHALTYGALGHVNEFVTKFWNQWMLLLLAWAMLGAGRFPGKRPCLAGLAVSAMVLLPITRVYALTEGVSIPVLFYTVLGSLQLAIGMAEKQPSRLRLGLLLMMATAMVKFEGLILLGLWGLVIMLDRDSRAALWPPRRFAWAGLLGLAAWLPYLVFRLHGPVPHPQSGWVSLLLTNASAVFHILPMTLAAMLSRRFLNSEFAAWGSPDNQHAVWQGHWVGWHSLVDLWTQGVGWVCLLLLVVAWSRGGRFRWTVYRLFLVFLVFATVVSLVWSTVQPSQMNYALALGGSETFTGGRYLYPVLMAWFLAGVTLLLREFPVSPAAQTGSQPGVDSGGRE